MRKPIAISAVLLILTVLVSSAGAVCDPKTHRGCTGPTVPTIPGLPGPTGPSSPATVVSPTLATGAAGGFSDYTGCGSATSTSIAGQSYGAEMYGQNSVSSDGQTSASGTASSYAAVSTNPAASVPLPGI